MRGLGNKLKRRAIFNYFRDKNLDIIFMQETHVVNRTKQLWQTEWGSKWFTASGTSGARGVVTMFNGNNNNRIKVNKTHVDHDGRSVICNIEVDETKLTLCSLYAPNEDNPKFFTTVFKTLSKIATDNIVIGGDFNTVLDVNMDRLCSQANNHQASKVIQVGMENLDLTDIWRTRNPTEKKYTWFKHTNTTSSRSALRIDYFLVNIGLEAQTLDTTISAGCRSDHSLITIEIENNNMKRGKGIWKFNNTLLADTQFCEGMINNLNESKQLLLNSGLDDVDVWENTKLRAYEFAKKYSINKCKVKGGALSNLYNLKDILQQECVDVNTTNNMTDTLKEINVKIKELENEKVQSIMFRSKCRYARLGEKNTSYYFALEKRNYNNKSMGVMFVKGSLSKDQKVILEEQKRFYMDLYTSDKTIQFNIRN